jgi:hypothetical protein
LPIIGSSQRVISRFPLAMRAVLQKEQRLVKEKLLSFGLDHIMLLRAIPGITSVPVEARYLRQVSHGCISSSYTSVASRDNKLFLSDQDKLSRRLLAQPPRQFTVALEQEL